MAATCFPAVAPKAAGSSPSATKERSGTPSSPTEVGFPKSRRLLKRSQFRRVYDSGIRVNSASFSVFYLRRSPSEAPETEGARAGFTTPRALGKAHDRNRIRRRMREAVRHEFAKADPSGDFIFHPRRNALSAPLDGLRREVEKVFLKCRT